MLIVAPHIRIPLREFEFTFARSSGPGGQNVNKVNSKALLRWPLMTSPSLPLDVRDRFVESFGSRLTSAGELIITSDRFRDRIRNQDDCLEKLKLMLVAVAIAPKRRKKTKPTYGSQTRRKDSKSKHGDKKKERRRPDYD